MQTLTKLIRMVIDDIRNGEQNIKYDVEVELLKSDVEYFINHPAELKDLVLTQFRIQKLGNEDILELFARLCSQSSEVKSLGKLGAISLLNIFNDIGENSSKEILQLILHPSGRMIWRIKDLLYDLLAVYQLEKEFAQEWFVGVHELVKTDMMNADFYNAIANHALVFPDSGEKFVRSYLARPSDDGLKQIAWMALGAIRIASMQTPLQKNVEELDVILKSSTNVKFREFYLLSWVTTFQKGGATIENILDIIREVGDRSEEELTAKSFLIFQTLSSKVEDSKQKLLLLDELYNVVDFTSFDSVKFWSLKLMPRLLNQEPVAEISSVLLLIFRKILPIENEKRGLWQLVGFLLIECKNCKSPLLTKYFELLFEFAAKELCEILLHTEFESIGHQIIETVDDSLLKSMLLSDRFENRKLVVTLIHHYNLSLQNLDKFSPNPKVLEDLLSDVVNEHFFGSISELLIMIEPLFADASPKLKQDFIDLMLHQGMNLPGACFNRWKEIQTKSEILENVCSKLELYFSNLADTVSIYPSKFEYYPFLNAAKQKQKMLAREISSGVKDKSVFMRLVEPKPILYSKRFIFFDAVGEVKINDLKPVGHEFELPHLEFMDPEGALKFRLSYTSKLKQE